MNSNQTCSKSRKRQKITSIRNRYTQVNSEEIDSWSIQKSHEDIVPGENKPIVLIDNEAIEPQCRFCLRRVSFENLKVISNDHKSKAMVAFQLKVFPRDVYPYGCINCLNLLDIFVDFKSAVTKAKRLLLTKRMHLDSEGWDDVIVTDAFQQCKDAVKQHRIQIEAVYEECVESTQSESSQTVDLANDRNIPGEEKHGNSENDIVLLHTVELDVVQIEHLPNDGIYQTIAMIDDSNIENPNESLSELVFGSTNELRNTEVVFDNMNESNSEIVIEEINESNALLVFEDTNGSYSELVSKENGSESTTLHSSKVKHASPNERNADEPGSSKKSKKVKTTTVSSTKHYQDHQLPAGIRVLCDICGESMYSQSLESHKNRHLGIKPYTCPVNGCGFMFYSRANMATHMRRMHAETGREGHKCDICGKFVRGQPGCLNVHKKRHTNERKYVCHLCGKGFTMTAYLRQHMLSHSVEFPHHCKYCDKKFNNKYSMKTHEKSIHEKNNHVPRKEKQC